MKRIMICGHGRSGKDEAGLYLAKITKLNFAGTTSLYLTKYVAAKLGVSESEAYARRHESDEMRMLWYNTGNEVRTKGPATLIREAMDAGGEILGGIRDRAEIRAAKQEGLCDISLWIERDCVQIDPTMTFGPEECDIVIQNNWTLGEYYERLHRFAKFAGLPMKV